MQNFLWYHPLQMGKLIPAHMLISIPPKYAVSQIVGFIKGKSAIPIARQYAGRKKKVQANIFEPEANMFQR